jgi:ribonuclease P protein component
MNRLTKNERLCSRKQIEYLITHGKSFFIFPFRVVYEVTSYELRVTGEKNHCQPSTVKCQFLITVPKRRIKKAVARNLVKRRTREAFRLNKQALEVNEGCTLQLILQYTADEPLPYQLIKEAVRAIIRQLK